MSNKILITIIGLPGTGKTTMANKLSIAMAGIPVISTDIVKAIYRSTGHEVLGLTSHTAWQLFGECTDDNIIKGFELQAEILYRYSLNISESLFKTYNTVVVEGLGIDLKKYNELRNYKKILIYLKNSRIDIAYKNKLQYRNDKNNNWYAHQSVLKVIDSYIQNKISYIDGAVITIDVADSYKIEQLIKEINAVKIQG